MSYTIEQAKAYVTEHREAMLQALAESVEVPAVMKKLPFIEILWCAGCWLGNHLESHGATAEQIKEIQFAHGQRCFSGDPYAVVVAYMNEFLTTQTVAEKPGPILAEKIHNEMRGTELTTN